MLCKVRGVVLKADEYGENDKLLTLLTYERGKMVVLCKGARSIKSKHMPSCEVFSLSEFSLYEKSGKYWVRESCLVESFFEIRKNLEVLYVAYYLCDLANEYALYDTPDENLLRLLLNSLFLLSKEKKDIRIIKSVFELKSSSLEGFMPDMGGCRYCSDMTENVYFDAIEGDFVCSKCKDKLNLNEIMYQNTRLSPILILDITLIETMIYIISSPIEKVFSFSLPDRELDMLGKVSEAFVLHQLERGFKTLDFLNSLLKH